MMKITRRGNKWFVTQKLGLPHVAGCDAEGQARAATVRQADSTGEKSTAAWAEVVTKRHCHSKEEKIPFRKV